MTNNTLTQPAPLDPTKLHGPTEVRMWKAEWASFHDSLRQQEAAQRQKAQAAQAEANRVLTEDEYHALAVKRHAEAQAKLAEREAAEKAQADAEAAYLASLPEVAEITEASEFLLLTKLAHWFALGYELTDDSIVHFIRGCYVINLKKSATAKRSKQ